MVEHPIEDQAHAAGMQGIDQGLEGWITTEKGIDLQVVVGVIAVIGR